MADKDLKLDEILGERSEKTTKGDSLDEMTADISFKNTTARQNNAAADMELDKILGFVKSDNSAGDFAKQKDEDVHISEQTELPLNVSEQKPHDDFDALDMHFGSGVKLEEQISDVQRPQPPVSTAPQQKVKKEKPQPKKKKKKKRRRSRFNGSIFGGIILVTIILTVSMLLAVAGISVGMEYYGIGKSDNDISFNIPEGSTNDEIADLLVENGIINQKKLFLLTIKLIQPDTIYPGDITLQPSMGYADIIAELEVMRESYETVTITFTEGENLIEIAQKLEENGVCTQDDFLFEFNKDQGFDFEENITDNENTFYAREGYFFPDTYEFYVDDTAYNVTKIVREHFESQLTDKMYTRMEKLDLSLNEVMTLASIVQLEAASVDEMPTVASVFLNRLDDPDAFPRLESDTTNKYITNVISTQADNQSTIEHYTDYYDTYQCKGLPAGPICNPGMDAIMAVLYPDETDYYFFCNNLETGETFYAKTLDEHEENLVKAGLVEAEAEDDE